MLIFAASQSRLASGTFAAVLNHSGAVQPRLPVRRSTIAALTRSGCVGTTSRVRGGPDGPTATIVLSSQCCAFSSWSQARQLSAAIVEACVQAVYGPCCLDRGTCDLRWAKRDDYGDWVECLETLETHSCDLLLQDVVPSVCFE